MTSEKLKGGGDYTDHRWKASKADETAGKINTEPPSQVTETPTDKDETVTDDRLTKHVVKSGSEKLEQVSERSGNKAHRGGERATTTEGDTRDGNVLHKEGSDGRQG